MKQNIQHVRVSLFQLVEQNDGIGLAADLFRQLARLVIADIAGGRADELRDGVALHVFRHIQPDERIDGVEQLVCEALDQLRLADTGRADKDERNGVLLHGDADAVAADGGGNGVDGLVLSDDVLLQPVLELTQLGIFLRANFTGGNFRPKLDDARKVLHGQDGRGLRLQLGDLGVEAADVAAQLGQTLEIVLLFRVLRQHLDLKLVVVALLALFGQIGDLLAVQVQIGASLIKQVDGLVRQEAVRDIALGEHDGLPRHFGRDGHTMKHFIVMRHAAQDGDGLLQRRLIDCDRLEAALERGVLFDVFAVFGKRRCADDLNFAARQRRLQNIGGVHGAFGIARADKVVNLIDDKNDVAAGLDLGDEAFHAALKLAAELRSGDERRQVEQIDLFVAQLERDIARDDALRQTLGDGRLADARLTDEAGIVLLTAVEDLHHTLRFDLAADDLVQLTGAGTAREAQTVSVEELVFLHLGLFRLAVLRLLRLLARGDLALIAEQAVHVRECRRAAADVVLVGLVRLRLHHGHHLAVEIVQILIRNAHALDDVVDLLDLQLAGALQAQALVRAHAVFDLRNKNHSDVLLASAADGRFHKLTPPGSSRASVKVPHCGRFPAYGRNRLAVPVPASRAVPSERARMQTAVPSCSVWATGSSALV